jgi:serine/threonine protein kinase
MDAGSMQDLCDRVSGIDDDGDDGGDEDLRVAVSGVEKRLMPESALAELARQCLEALAHLHAQRQVHRDIKPHNILYVASVHVMFFCAAP